MKAANTISVDGNENILLQDIENSTITIISASSINIQLNIIREKLIKLIPFEIALRKLIELRETSGTERKIKRQITKDQFKEKKSLIYNYGININLDVDDQIQLKGNEYLEQLDKLEQDYLNEFKQGNIGTYFSSTFPTLKSKENINSEDGNKSDGTFEYEKILDKNNNLERFNSLPEAKEETINNEINKIIDARKNDENNRRKEEIKKEFEKKYELLKTQIDIKISQLATEFLQTVYSITNYSDLLGNMVTKIGHKDLLIEAQMHLRVSINLGTDIDNKIGIDNIKKPGFDILSNDGIGALGIMSEIEKRRIVVERIISIDLKKQKRTTVLVTIYIISVLIAISILIIQNKFKNFIPPFLPKDYTFWAVSVWSLIGSFASMIHRFNNNPIHDFGNAIKWLITRPVQGLVLGAALYLVMITGQSIFSSNTQIGDFGNSEKFVLLLSFLVGFSDKLGESIFNTLIKNYMINEPEKSNSNKSQIEGGNI